MQRSLMRLAVLAFCIGLALGCDQRSGTSPRDATAREDTDRLIGVWDYVSVTYDGKPFDVGEKAYAEITPENWTIFRNGNRLDAEWSIDGKESPKQLNQRVITSQGEEFVMKSVYRFNGDDELVICEPDHPEKLRPADFDGGKGHGQFLVVLHRHENDKQAP